MGFLVLGIRTIFGSVFLLKRFFGFGFLRGLRVLSEMMAIFRSFLSNAFYGFSGFAKEITTAVALTAIPIKDHLYSVLPFVCKPSLRSSRCLSRKSS